VEEDGEQDVDRPGDTLDIPSSAALKRSESSGGTSGSNRQTCCSVS